MLGKCSKNQRITFSSVSNLMVQTDKTAWEGLMKAKISVYRPHLHCFLANFLKIRA